MSFIGRGEERTIHILKHLFPGHQIIQQMNIKSLIGKLDYQNLGKEHSQHNHDIVLLKEKETIVIEVNYNHGVVAEQKWHNVYKPLLEDIGHITGTIEDGECESLFDLENGVHVDSWQDWIDVIGCLQKDGILESEIDN